MLATATAALGVAPEWLLIDSHLDRGAVQVEGARVTSAPSARLRNEAGARAVTVRVAPAPR